MKTITIIWLCILILMVGCNSQNDDYYPLVNDKCICDTCIRINLDQYQGNYLFYDGISAGKIEFKDYSVPTESEIKVCKDIHIETGDCEQEIFKFKLGGKC